MPPWFCAPPLTMLNRQCILESSNTHSPAPLAARALYPFWTKEPGSIVSSSRTSPAAALHTVVTGESIRIAQSERARNSGLCAEGGSELCRVLDAWWCM